jgi:LysR family cyn operon transcriptional activator
VELRHLRYFVELSKHLSFTQAAERVHVTQSTLSHQIRQLEEELGTTLFERHGRGVSLTWTGQLFLPAANKALKDLDVAVMSLRHNAMELSGRLTIGAAQTFNLEVVPSCLVRFLSEHPKVEVVIEESSADVLVEKVADGTYDMAVAYNPFSGEGVEFEPLCSEELVLVTALDHPLAKRRRVRVAELHAIGMALLSTRFATRQLIDSVFTIAGVRPNTLVHSVSIPMLLHLVRSSQLCTILSRLSVAQGAGVAVVPLEAPSPVRVSGVIWPSGRPRTREMLEFGSIIRVIASNLSSESTRAA